MKEQLIAMIFKSLIALLSAILSIVIPYLIKQFKSYMELKGKAVQYNRALGVGRGIYFGLEDEFKEIEKSGDIKKEEMKNRLLQIFPTLTDVELESINKDICHTIDIGIKELGTPIK